MRESEPELPNFHLVVTPGFEDVALHELQTVDVAVTEIQMHKGGIDFQAELEVGLSLNAVLKIPTRILLRLGEKKCKSFDELRAFVNELPWPDYLQSPKLKIKISSFKSKLYHKVQIEDVFQRAMRAYFREKNLQVNADASEQEILLRIEHNFVGVSINTSGEALYKRGYKHLSGVAPLRENLAYACLYKITQLLGDKSELKFLDPMCGSGTFVLEALLFNQHQKRVYAFQEFPIWKWKNIGVLDKSCTIQFKAQAWDKYEEALESLKKSVKASGVTPPEIELKDLFQSSSNEKFDFILLNPPYGHRISLPKPARVFWPELHKKLSDFNASLFAFLLPVEAEKFLPKPSGKISFSNGGVPVSLFWYFKS